MGGGKKRAAERREFRLDKNCSFLSGLMLFIPVFPSFLPTFRPACVVFFQLSSTSPIFVHFASCPVGSLMPTAIILHLPHVVSLTLLLHLQRCRQHHRFYFSPLAVLLSHSHAQSLSLSFALPPFVFSPRRVLCQVFSPSAV